MTRRIWCAAALLIAMQAGGIVTAGTFKTIVIDDAYADWAGVPVVDSDAGDNFGGPDIADTQIANDNQYLYIRNTFANSLCLVLLFPLILTRTLPPVSTSSAPG